MMRITGGKYNSIKIKTPEFDNIKPTLSKTRQGIFNTLASMIDFEGKIFLDMFSGSAIMSIEAISRGFKAVSFEKDKKTYLAIEVLLKSLNIESEIYFGDALKNILKINVKPDVIFLDPPYNSDLYEKSLEIIKNNNISAPNGIIVIEHPAKQKINYCGFELIKTKIYGNKKITFINREE